MRRGARSLLVLAFVAALLGAAVYAELAHERAQAMDPLTAIDLDAVTWLDVACVACGSPRRFEKIGGHWRMRAPFDRAADDAAVERLLAIAHAPVRLRRARGELDPAKLGLEPPQVVLTLDAVSIRFGATDAIDGDRYVDAGGDTIALVPDRFSARLFEPAEREAPSPSR